MKYLGSLLLIPMLGYSAITVTGPAQANPGSTVIITLSSSETTTAALQWTIRLPPGYTIKAVNGFSQTTKTLSCTASFGTCIMWALDTFLVGTGSVSTYSIGVPGNATGNVIITLSGLVGATPDGLNVPVSAGPAYQLGITKRKIK